VLKKRTGDFENTLREFKITEYGLKVGQPLTELRDILRGTPDLVDSEPSS
jgi:circadian clock protein KaiC